MAIGNQKTDWVKIRAEYISGNGSTRKLAEKYGVSYSTLRRRAESEGWVALRENAERKANARVAQKTAEKAADNATLAADIKRKGLLIIDRLFDAYMELDCTEQKLYDKRETRTRKLKDLTAAYKDLTGDMVTNTEQDSALLRSLLELERRSHD